jgi:hypothetical protein
LGLSAQHVQAQEWQAAGTAPPTNSYGITLRAPVPLPGTATSEMSLVQPASLSETDVDAPRVIRAQGLDPVPVPTPTPSPFTPLPTAPPPPPVPGGIFAGAPDQEKYNCAVKAKSQGGFWDQTREGIAGIPGMFTSPSRSLFQSDHCFDVFCSPVSNPFFFEDPRALTEVKPLVIFQRVPGSNPAFGGGDIWFYGLQGRLAINDVFSVVVSKLGGITLSPNNHSGGISSDSGFAEVMLGPKFTFYRCESSKTVLAAGLNFDLAIGSSGVFQNTGDLSLIPYISFAQNFGGSSWGSFNFMNTTGYSFATDNTRTDFFYSSFHLDYDIANLNKIFPLIEINWFHYTQNGSSGTFYGFEGRDLINFGSGGVAGHDDVSLAVGFRYKFAEWAQVGFVFEFPLVDKHKDLMDYRFTLDLIFRY